MANRNPRQGRKLKSYRVRMGLSVRAAAEQLNVSHSAILLWESGKTPPSKPFREAIERWTGGHVAAPEWTLSERERLVVARLGEVNAAEPALARVDGMSR